jgi:hypothetical protein
MSIFYPHKLIELSFIPRGYSSKSCTSHAAIALQQRLFMQRYGGLQEINNPMKMVQTVQQLNISFCLKLVVVSDSDDYNISLNI